MATCVDTTSEARGVHRRAEVEDIIVRLQNQDYKRAFCFRIQDYPNKA